MQLIAKTENETITIFDSKNEIVGKIQLKNNLKECHFLIDDKIYEVVREKWLTKIIQNQQTIYHLRTDKFWGTIKIEELNKEIRGIFGFTWGTQLRDSYKQALLKIRTDNQFKNKGNYIIQLDKVNIKPIEVLMALYGHVIGSIAKQNIILYT